MKEGYPDRVCDYCQLQLNTFHAFVRKAKITSKQFEGILQELKQNIFEDNDHSEDQSEDVQISDMLTATDMEFEMTRDDGSQEKSTKQSIEVEFLDDKREVELICGQDLSTSANGDDGKNIFKLNFKYITAVEPSSKSVCSHDKCFILSECFSHSPSMYFILFRTNDNFKYFKGKPKKH